AAAANGEAEPPSLTARGMLALAAVVAEGQADPSMPPPPRPLLALVRLLLLIAQSCQPTTSAAASAAGAANPASDGPVAATGAFRMTYIDPFGQEAVSTEVAAEAGWDTALRVLLRPRALLFALRSALSGVVLPGFSPFHWEAAAAAATVDAVMASRAIASARKAGRGGANSSSSPGRQKLGAQAAGSGTAAAAAARAAVPAASRALRRAEEVAAVRRPIGTGSSKSPNSKKGSKGEDEGDGSPKSKGGDFFSGFGHRRGKDDAAAALAAGQATVVTAAANLSAGAAADGPSDTAGGGGAGSLVLRRRRLGPVPAVFAAPPRLLRLPAGGERLLRACRSWHEDAATLPAEAAAAMAAMGR
ncbi:unnamed protein product, partial [Phaeothamnion confervicola]